MTSVMTMVAHSQPANLKDIERHVLDDVAELIATIGVANPIVCTTLISEMEGARREVVVFLRGVLSRHVILVATRLHALKGAGGTGETASIESYVHYAELEGRISTSQANEFRSQRQAIIAKLEKDGIKFSADLYSFRNAELAHSLHPSAPLTNPLLSLPVFDFADATYQLVLKIEKSVSGNGKLNNSFQAWFVRGNEFWKPLQDNES
jgi:hypothetical protein